MLLYFLKTRVSELADCNDILALPLTSPETRNKSLYLFRLLRPYLQSAVVKAIFTGLLEGYMD